jgi:hypothetical protein
MKPFVCSFCFLSVIFLNCAGIPLRNLSKETKYPAGVAVFTGVSNGHYLSKDRAIALALQDAARQVSFFHSVEAIVKTSEIYNPRFRISRVDDERELVYDTDYEKYIPLLEFDAEQDVYEEYGALFVHAVYTGETVAAGSCYWAEPGRPLWVENPPAESGGLIYAVGFAGPRLSYKDAVVASYEDAVYTFVASGFYKIYTSQQLNENTLFDTSYIFVSGMVKGFRVITVWRDPESGAVWTLAVAREVIPKTEE